MPDIGQIWCKLSVSVMVYIHWRTAKNKLGNHFDPPSFWVMPKFTRLFLGRGSPYPYEPAWFFLPDKTLAVLWMKIERPWLMVDGPDQAIVERHILLLYCTKLWGWWLFMVGIVLNGGRGEDSINENVCNCENQRSHSGSWEDIIGAIGMSPGRWVTDILWWWFKGIVHQFFSSIVQISYFG